MESLVPSTECREAGVHQALKALSCDKPVRDKLGHIKGVKNEIIGNRKRRYKYARDGLVDLLVATLRAAVQCRDTEVIIQSVVAIGSLAHEGSVQEKFEVSGCYEEIIKLIFDEDARVVEASLGSLKALSQLGGLKIDERQRIKTLHRLLGFLDESRSPRVVRLVCETLPSLMPALGVPDAIVQHQGHAAIARCVCMGGERLRIAATGALQALASTGQAAARAILDDPDCLAFIRDSLRRSPVAAQIEACALVRCIRAALGPPVLSEEHELTEEEFYGRARGLVREAAQALVLLLQEAASGTALLGRVAAEIGGLWEADGNLQCSHVDTDTVATLASAIVRHPPHPRSTLQAVLQALAALCLVREQARCAALNCRIPGPLLRLVESSAVPVRLAACTCLLSLARSSSVLMQAFRDVAVLRPVFDAVGSDTDPAVAAKACAVLCNLVTFDATLKKEVISNLCARNMRNHIFDSRGEELRHNALLFFKNLSYEAPVFVIKDVLQTLNLEEELENLLQDKDTRIQETTWGILRNLASCTGGSEGIGADLVLGKIGWDKLRAHVERVTSSSGAATTGPHGRILEHAIFFVANITGSLERAKGLVMESEILQHIKQLLQDMTAPPRAISGALWVVLNLAYRKEVADKAALLQRVMKLKELGFPELLERVKGSEDLDVAQRARQARDEIRASTEAPGGEGAGRVGGGEMEGRMGRILGRSRGRGSLRASGRAPGGSTWRFVMQAGRRDAGEEEHEDSESEGDSEEEEEMEEMVEEEGPETQIASFYVEEDEEMEEPVPGSF